MRKLLWLLNLLPEASSVESSISPVKVSKVVTSPIFKFNCFPHHIPHPSLLECKLRNLGIGNDHSQKTRKKKKIKPSKVRKTPVRREICTPGEKLRIKFRLKEKSCSENLYVPHSEDFLKARCFQMQTTWRSEVPFKNNYFLCYPTC